MTTYTFSQLLNNQTIAFNESTDVLLFDGDIRPAELLINATASGVQFSVDGKSIVLTGITLDDIGGNTPTGPSNVRFQSTGVLLVGEGTTGGGGAGANSILGGLGDDALLGLAGDDLLNGAAGADLMIGGLGNDVYKVENIGDVVTEENQSIVGAGIDTVDSVVTFTLGNYIENLNLKGNAAVDGTGNSLVNVMTGNAAANVLNGMAGADTMTGGDGNDSYFVDNINDKVIETNNIRTQIDTVNSTLNYTLAATLERLVLLTSNAVFGVGNHRANTITGSVANNTLNGMQGADVMIGGDGGDTYIVDNAGDVVTETNTNPLQIDMVASSVNYTLGTAVENLRLMGSANLNGTGNGLNNTIFANVGNNVINGAAGVDTVSYANVELATLVEGVPGTRQVTLSATHGVEVSLAITTQQDTRGSGFDTLIGVENLTGSNYSDQLTGSIGNNVLDGGLSADLLIGGKGNDTYIVDGADIVVEFNAALDGVDTVNATVSYRLADNVENLVLLGNAINGTGNNLNNRLTGNGGNNFLDGGAGGDQMEGGQGNDTFVVDNLGDQVSDFAGVSDMVLTYVNYTLNSSIENLRLMGQNALNGTGNTLSNIIWVNSGNNVVSGGTNGVAGDTISYQFGATSGVIVDLSVTSAQTTSGSGTDTLSGFENLIGSDYNDVLSGSSVLNLLDGRGGVDTISYATSGGPVVLDLIAKTATVGGVVDSILNFENVIGSAFADILRGDRGDNTFDGRGGTDTVSYANLAVTDGGVIADLSKTGFQDTGGAGLDKFESIENLTGSNNNDILTGNGGNNALDGLLGNDILHGGAGIDTAYYWHIAAGTGVTVNLGVTTAQNTIAAGIDILDSMENVVGSINNDTLTGSSGANVIDGGLGNDLLNGGLGNDVFLFNSGLSSTNIDTIADYNVAQDTIQLANEFFSGLPAGALAATAFVLGTSALDASDRIIYNKANGALFFDADGNGAVAAIRFATISNLVTLTAADFFIV